MKKMLEIGDKIQRYEFENAVGCEMTIISVTKTLAKTEHKVFKRQIELNGYVSLKKDIGGLKTKYFKI